jgi:hypothetical protein
MGNASRVVVVGAMSLVVGIYGLSLKKVQAVDLDASLMPVKRVQYERKVAAAVRSAMSDWELKYRLYGPPSTYPYQLTGPTTSCLGGGSFNYTFTYDPYYHYADLSLSMTSFQDSLPRVITARVENLGSYWAMTQGPQKMRRGVWQTTKFFVQRGW